MQRGCSATAQILDAVVEGAVETSSEKVLVVDLLPNRLHALMPSANVYFPILKDVKISGENEPDCCHSLPGWLSFNSWRAVQVQ